MDNKMNSMDYITVFGVIGIGVFLFILSLLNLSFFSPEAPNKYIITVFSAIVTLLGIYFLIKMKRGKLTNEEAKTIIEIRMEAIQNMKDASVVAETAQKSPFPEVREAALKRLAELDEE